MRTKLDLNGCMAARIGNEGLLPEDIAVGAELAGRIERERRDEGKHAYLDLPRVPEAEIAAIEAFAADARARFRTFLAIGIGGSALGNKALHRALDPCSPDRRVTILDNVDPETVAAALDACDPRTTLVNVVSKSGETAEIAANFAIVLDWLRSALGRDGWRGNVVATTDPKKGTLREIATEHGLASFPIPPRVGGRFSVLSPVGLVSAAYAGIDIRALLAGAGAAVEAGLGLGSRSPAAAYGTIIERFFRRGKPIAVFMTYADAMAGVGEWLRQLLAESLGKHEGCGSTPTCAVGATDQHSQLQLYMEGPRDKWLTFIEVERFRREVRIPSVFPERKAFRYLEGRDLAELLNGEKRGTEVALASAGRPTCTFRMPSIDAGTVGELLYTLALATTFAGALLGIDAYDQPGVEASKVATYALMGREGHEAKRDEVLGRLAPDRELVF